MVPEHSLQDPSYFDDTEKLWMWKFEGNDMYMDLGEGGELLECELLETASPSLKG